MPSISIEKAESQRLFQVSNLHRKSGLRYVKELSRTREAAKARYGQEGSNLRKINVHFQ
jgi:hypothetical protein